MHSSIIPTSESITVEFKTSFNEDVIETLVAFSNAKGGTVYLGLDEYGKIKGIQTGKETIQNWINEVKNKTSPQIIPDIEILTFDNKHVAAISVIEYPVKPVSKRGRYYKRISTANHLMSVDEIANEHLKTINSSWDFYQDPIHRIKDISFEKVTLYIKIIEHRTQSKIGISEMDFLKKLEIIRENKLTFGGYLLFVKDHCLISDVQVGRFKSETTIIDSVSFDTDLFTETDEIIAFIKKHLMVEYIITGEPQRTERFDYPLDAIREIVINMIVHRDYRDSSGSIIKIFDDRIEFYNPGKLYGGITIQDLLSGIYTSKTRNKLIAKAFKEIGLTERYGSGIMRIRKICEEFGIKDPVFKEIGQGFQVILFKEKINNHIDSLRDVPENVPENRMIKILKLITENNLISISYLAQQCGVTEKTIKRDIEKLKQKQLIKRIGPDKGGHWEVTQN